MKIVDDIGVGMSVAPVGYAFVPMRITGGQAVMGMFDHLRIDGGPKPHGRRHGGPCKDGKNDSSCGKPKRRARPTCQRIGDEPAGM